jgi:putative transcriptional regulator
MNRGKKQETEKMCVQNCVQKFRKEKGITQEQMAQGLEITRQTVIAIEKGNYTPSVLLAMKIARFFDVPVESLFTLDCFNE